jgi:DNA-binding transcriptional LysR family regulator
VVAGRLVPNLHELHLPRRLVNIAYRRRSLLPGKVRVFIDFLGKHFRHMDNQRKWAG